MRSADPYLAVFRQTFKRQSTYRVATIAGVVTNTLFGVLFAYVYVAVYHEQSDIRGLDVTDALTLTFITQGMLLTVTTFGWRELADRVRTGDVATDLQRPVDQSGYWLAAYCGASTFSFFARGIPPFVLGGLVFHLHVPDEASAWAGFLACVAGATILASRWWLLVNITAFWIVDARGVIQLACVIQLFCQGAVVQLQFFSDTVGDIVRATPWAAMGQLPGEVFLGLQSAPRLLAMQLAWIAVFEIALRLALSSATRKLVIQGG
jgi:ABC-2 type transport system permease protein